MWLVGLAPRSNTTLSCGNLIFYHESSIQIIPKWQTEEWLIAFLLKYFNTWREFVKIYIFNVKGFVSDVMRYNKRWVNFHLVSVNEVCYHPYHWICCITPILHLMKRYYLYSKIYVVTIIAYLQQWRNYIFSKETNVECTAIIVCISGNINKRPSSSRQLISTITK